MISCPHEKRGIMANRPSVDLTNFHYKRLVSWSEIIEVTISAPRPTSIIALFSDHVSLVTPMSVLLASPVGLILYKDFQTNENPINRIHCYEITSQ